MKITEEFLEQSIFPKSLIEITDLMEEEDGKIILEEIFSFSPDGLKRLVDAIFKTTNSMRACQYQQARINILSSHKFDSGGLNERIKSNYKNIKSLITGLIRTSSIIKEYEIKEYQAKWSDYADKDISKYRGNEHHQKIYNEFKQINKMQELINFNAYFQQYILNLMYDFTDDLLARIKYTFEFLEIEFPMVQTLYKFKEIHSELTEKIKELKLK